MSWWNEVCRAVSLSGLGSWLQEHRDMVAWRPAACRAQSRSLLPLGCRSQGMAEQRWGSHTHPSLSEPSGTWRVMEGGWDILRGRAGPSYTDPAVLSRLHRSRPPPAPAYHGSPAFRGSQALPAAGRGWSRSRCGPGRERRARGVKLGLTLGPAQAGVRKEERADGAVPPSSGFRPPSRDPSGQARSLRAAVPELGSGRAGTGPKRAPGQRPPCPTPCSPAQCRVLRPPLSLLHRPRAPQPH